MIGKLNTTNKIGIFSLTLVTLLITSTPVTSVVGFNEDFSNPSNEWLFYGSTNDTTTWEFQDETLVSAGTPSFGDINFACHKTNDKLGPWKFDIFEPDISQRIGFRVATFPSPIENNTYTQDTPSFQLVSGSIHEPPRLMLGQYSFATGFVNLVYTSLSDYAFAGWHTYEIIRDDLKIEAKMDGNTMYYGDLNASHIAEYDSICIWTDIGSGVKIDNIVVGQDTPIVTDSPVGFFENPVTLITGTIILLGGIGFGARFIYQKKTKKASNTRRKHQNILQQTVNEFHLSDKSILSLITGAYKSKTQLKTNEYKDIIPQELLTYRYLMHPIRLSIMKLLDVEDKMPSVQIKHILDISWGEYSNHIKSLEDRGYIEILDEFNEEGLVNQVACILENGRNEYFQLIQLLEKFIGNQSPFHELLSGKSTKFGDRELYPK